MTFEMLRVQSLHFEAKRFRLGRKLFIGHSRGVGRFGGQFADGDAETHDRGVKVERSFATTLAASRVKVSQPFLDQSLRPTDFAFHRLNQNRDVMSCRGGVDVGDEVSHPGPVTARAMKVSPFPFNGRVTLATSSLSARIVFTPSPELAQRFGTQTASTQTKVIGFGCNSRHGSP